MRDLLSQNYLGETIRYAECMIHQTLMEAQATVPGLHPSGTNLPAVVVRRPIAHGRRDFLPPPAVAVREGLISPQ